MTFVVLAQVLLTACALVCAYSARRDWQRTRAALQAGKALAARLAAAPGDAYRTSAVLPAVVRGPVYCEDCRFKVLDPYGYAACLAMPDGGQYLRIGGESTNKNHDCEHWQEEEEKT